jgi:hypothetical protein
MLVSDATPLPSVLTTLKERSHSFVLIGSAVRGIVTRADLNKPPVRVYLFGLVSLLEMHLGFWIRVTYPDTTWEAELGTGRLDAARALQAERQKRGHEASLLGCIQFCDKRDLVAAKGDLRDRLGLGNERDAIRLLRRAEDLRNLLAHSQQDLVQGSSWEELIGIVQSIEKVVDTSDARVEEEAKAVATGGLDGLWASI